MDKAAKGFGLQTGVYTRAGRGTNFDPRESGIIRKVHTRAVPANCSEFPAGCFGLLLAILESATRLPRIFAFARRYTCEQEPDLPSAMERVVSLVR